MAGSYWWKEDPKYCLEGDEFAYALRIRGAKVLLTPTMTAFQKGSSVTSTVLAGSTDADIVINSNVLTLRKIIIPSDGGGKTYVVCVTTSCDGTKRTFKCRFKATKLSDEV
jgi:hypothetical protein